MPVHSQWCTCSEQYPFQSGSKFYLSVDHFCSWFFDLDDNNIQGFLNQLFAYPELYESLLESSDHELSGLCICGKKIHSFTLRQIRDGGLGPVRGNY